MSGSSKGSFAYGKPALFHPLTQKTTVQRLGALYGGVKTTTGALDHTAGAKRADRGADRQKVSFC